jgi:uncharacterized membrane protein YfcA
MQILILAILIFLGFFIQTITGFGSNVFILTLGILFFDFYQILPIVLSFNIIMCIYIIIKNYKYLNIKLIIEHILIFMGIGFIIGLVISNYIKNLSININKLLAILILALSLSELYLLLIKKNLKFTNKFTATFWIFVSGIVHAIFATGGPFLVYGLSHLNIDKEFYRISLMFIWLIFNTILLINTPFSYEHFKLVMYLIGILPISIYLGQKIYNKISIERFQIIIRTVLIFTSLAVLLK